MSFNEEERIFDDFVKSKGLKNSEQRRDILRAFLGTEKHLTVDELHKLVKKKYLSIGTATVYRTLKLLRESGLCREFKLDDGASRYEHLYGHKHHDHLVCESRGRLIEVFNPEIERLQEKLAKSHGFKITSHKLEIYGVCNNCRN